MLVGRGIRAVGLNRQARTRLIRRLWKLNPLSRMKCGSVVSRRKVLRICSCVRQPRRGGKPWRRLCAFAGFASIREAFARALRGRPWTSRLVKCPTRGQGASLSWQAQHQREPPGLDAGVESLDAGAGEGGGKRGASAGTARAGGFHAYPALRSCSQLRRAISRPRPMKAPGGRMASSRPW